MKKVLRSLIHEKFPLDLRVKIDILSRRRDIVNKEKQEELMKLLREFNIEGVVPLGPGTNRYAFKLDGFVIKVATDHDGKIDNFKEFKMAKRLFPYVTKIYEVSDNGTLLVAEYIQPFESFTEMIKYSDQIRKILDELASVYLIGDVGITSKNYANWGLRVGTQDVVCLDFAYVYEVSSGLFICKKCKTNSMILPNKDYTELYCSNPSCKAKYTFEDIRSRLGNDIHNHEIGNLKDEGYEMFDTNTEYELDLERSNYLAKKIHPKKSKSKKVSKDVIEDVNEDDNKEEEEMNGVFSNVSTVVDAIKRSENDVRNIHFIASDVVKSVKNGATKVVESQVAKPKDVIPDELEEEIKEVGENVEEDLDEEVEYGKMINKFIENITYAVSSISNDIDSTLRENDMFSGIREYVKDKKMLANAVYKTIQNCIYKSLVKLLKFEDHPTETANGTRHHYSCNKDVLKDVDCFMNFMFISRYYELRSEAPSDRRKPYTILTKYANEYDNYFGLTETFKDIFKETLEAKLPISEIGINLIINAVFEDWGRDDEEEEEREAFIEEEADLDPKEGLSEKSDGPAYDENGDPFEEVDPEDIDFDDLPDEIGEEESNDEDEEDQEEMVPAEDIYEDIDDEEDEDEEDYEDNDEVQNPRYLSIEFFEDPDDESDIIRIMTEDAFGIINIPLYVNMSSIDVDNAVKSGAVNERNGLHDWLVNINPDVMFRTKDPDKYLESNPEDDEWGPEQMHCAIMDEEDDGVYVMGIWFLQGINAVDEDDNYTPLYDKEFIKKLNYVISRSIGIDSDVSHYYKSLEMQSLIYDEKYIKMFTEPDSQDDEDEDEAEEVEVHNEVPEDFMNPPEELEEEEEVNEEDQEEDEESVEEVSTEVENKEADEELPEEGSGDESEVEEETKEDEEESDMEETDPEEIEIDTKALSEAMMGSTSKGLTPVTKSHKEDEVTEEKGLTPVRRK